MESVQSIHMVGICGVGMGTVAGLLKAAGYDVTGSDENVYPPMSIQLRDLGIEYNHSYAAEHIKNPDLVIIGNTAKQNNPEVQEVFARGLRYMSFPQAMAHFFFPNRTSVVVAGTHGKTTTTSLVSWVLDQAQRQPSFFIGGVAKNFGTSFKLNEGPHFVIEGDEYDTAFFNKVPKFTHYQPTLGLLNSIEFDHADIYPTFEHVNDAFRTYVRLFPSTGFLAACVDFPAVREVMLEAKCNVETYGLHFGAMWHGTDLVFSEDGTEFTVMRGHEVYGRFYLPLAGRHNVQNALGAIALCHRIGLTAEEIKRGLATFEGVRRRQDVRGVVNDVMVIDDFAHHPTEVHETIRAIKSRYPLRRLWAIWEPRTQSNRRNYFQDQFPRAFSEADKVYIADVFRPDLIEPEKLFSPRQLVQELVSQGKDARFLPGADAIVASILPELAPGDVILVMSNGAFDGIHEKLLNGLEARFKEREQPAVPVLVKPNGKVHTNGTGKVHTNGNGRVRKNGKAHVVIPTEAVPEAV